MLTPNNDFLCLSLHIPYLCSQAYLCSQVYHSRGPTAAVEFMAAAKALLTAAGMLKPKTCTATEHASSSSLQSTATEHASPWPLLQSTATEHADISARPLTGIPMSRPASDPDVRFLLGDADLEKLVALLLWMAQDFSLKISEDDIHDAALDSLVKCSDEPTGGALGPLHTASIAKLSNVIDIMLTQKDGSTKDATKVLPFMRRIARIRQRLLANKATEHQRGRRTMLQSMSSRGNDNATEHAELDADDVSLCYQRFGRSLIRIELLPHQKANNKYRLQDRGLTTFQRSFVDNMLRKFLGEKRVALLIWQHGLPSIVNPPEEHDLGLLQSSLDECLQWYVALATDIAAHQTQDAFEVGQSLSSLDETERQRQQTRREALQKARTALRRGATLQQERDQNKRTFQEMKESEQEMLEDYETGRAKKAKKQHGVPKMQPFRCKLEIGQGHESKDATHTTKLKLLLRKPPIND